MRLYNYYRTLAPQLPGSFGDMEPLFLAVICGCNAGLYRKVLHGIYIPRIQRGNDSFAANVLGARGALLSVLCHFFEDGRWDSALETGATGQNLTAEDQLFILIQAALNLSATRGFSTPEARLCYERAESFCRSLDRPLLLYLALIGQWRYSLLTDSLTATMQIAKRVYSLAEEHNTAAFMVGACNALAATLFALGDFENARQYAMRGVQVWSSGDAHSPAEEVDAPGVTCLYFRALAEWHVGEVVASKSSMAEAVSLAKRLNDLHAVVLARYHAAVLGVYERDPVEVERCASDLFELSTRQNFTSHLSAGTILRGWARSVSGEAIQGISWIESGTRDFRATGSVLGMPFFLALKAEALHAAHRTSKALEAINEAERLVEKSGQRNWCAELHRLRGVFLAATGASEAQIEASFSAAIRTAVEQGSISLATRAEASQAEYRRKREAAVDPLTISLPTAKGLERSIAVLPFDALSQRRRDTYFADGVQNEILSRLAKVSQLKVISRTSVMTYRAGGNRDLRSIAIALGVANVVEGTVRRDSNRIRITIRLVDARRDEALWCESYDRDLTDIFFVQSEIAQAVANELSVHLSSEEQRDIEERPTENLEAYDLYLQARELITKGEFLWIGEGDSRENFLHAIGLLEAAIHLDSKFALAYCSMAKAHDDLYIHRFDRTPERRALGDTAVNEALRLRPDLPEVHLAAALHLCETYRNCERARIQVEIAARGLPNSVDVLWLAAAIDRRRGRWAETIRGLQKAVSLDPRNVLLLQSLATGFVWLRRYRDSEQTLDRLIAVKPDKPLAKVLRANVVFRERADLASFRNLLEKLPSSTKGEIDIASWRFECAMLARDWTKAHEILMESPNDEFYFSYAWAVVPRGCLEVWLARLQRRRPRRHASFVTIRDELNRKVEACPEDAGLLSVLSIIDTALGRKEEAIQEAKHATELLPISKDAWEGPRIVSNLAVVFAWTDELDSAFQQLAISVNTPGGVSYGELKLDPCWDPLHKDPRFDKLLSELAPKD